MLGLFSIFLKQFLWESYNALVAVICQSGIKFVNRLYSAEDSHITLEIQYLLLLNFSDLLVFHHGLLDIRKGSFHLSDFFLELRILIFHLNYLIRLLLHLS